ncbi:MAG: hypothetical protein IH596_07280 [Bacteroidales bacterium]|nr:hypothetical protein [Bacteroidales bacterium]
MKAKGKNALVKGFSGKFGDQFSFRQRNGETIIAALPSVPPKATPERVKRRNLFKEAVAFARRVKEDPSLIREYGIKVRKKQSIYHAAISAYMNSNGELPEKV